MDWPASCYLLPDQLQEQLQATLRLNDLPPQHVQGGHLVLELSNLMLWTLELSVLLSEIEGKGVLLSLVTGHAESPGWEQGSVKNKEHL